MRKSAAKKEIGAPSISTAALEFLGQMKLHGLMTGDETDRAKTDTQFLAQSLNAVLCGVASDRPTPTDARFKAGTEAAKVMAEHIADHMKEFAADDGTVDGDAAYKDWLNWRKANPLTVLEPAVAPPGTNLPMDNPLSAAEVTETSQAETLSGKDTEVGQSSISDFEEKTDDKTLAMEQKSDVLELFSDQEQTQVAEPAPESPAHQEAGCSDCGGPDWCGYPRCPGGEVVTNDASEPEKPAENVVWVIRNPEDINLLPEPLSFALSPAVVELPIKWVMASELNPRQFFNEAQLQRLASDIAQFGQDPITVRHCHNRRQAEWFEIVAGERRWRACQILARETIRVQIVQCDDAELVRRAMVENLSREDLDPISTAIGIQKTMELSGLSQGEVAAQYNLSQPVVSRLLGLLTLPAKIYNALQEGRLSQSHGFALLPLLRHAEEHRKNGRENQAACCFRDLGQLAARAETDGEGEPGMSKATLEAEVGKVVAMYPHPRVQNLGMVIEDATPEPQKETAGTASSSAPSTTSDIPPVEEAPSSEPTPAPLVEPPATTPVKPETTVEPETIAVHPVPAMDLPEPTPGRVDVSITLESAEILHKRGFDADRAIAMADQLFAARDILTPNSIALLGALVAHWNDQHPDAPMTLAERLETLLATRCEQLDIDAQAICDGVAAALETSEEQGDE